MSSRYELECDQRIQDTIEDLCVAKYAKSYCSSCSSGSGCCVDPRRKDSFDSNECDETVVLESERMEMLEGEWYEQKKVKRKTLTIDLTKDRDLSDGEILKRLLSPLGSPLSDEPLEVILEIVDEEDDASAPQTTTCKSFESLRRKLEEVTSVRTPRNDTADSQLKYRSNNYNTHFSNHTDIITSESRRKKSYSSVQTCPSYKKANNLINEIEKCFLETSNLVEKTLGASKSPRNSQTTDEATTTHFNSSDDILSSHNMETAPPFITLSASSSSFTNKEETEHLTQTIHEALKIFDSILSETKNKNKPSNPNKKYDGEEPNISMVNNNLNNYDNSIREQEYYRQNQYGITESKENWNSQTSPSLDEHILNQMSWKKMTSGFDRDVDELFKECYDMSSVEPSTSLGSCLTNLKSLCFQLRKAKENILYEIKEQYHKKRDYDNENYDTYGSQASSLDSQECLSFINELMEKKLKEKLKHRKFSLDPPLMGLEGKTHKVIAEVIPEKSIRENGFCSYKENDFQVSPFRGNYDKIKDISLTPNDTANILYEDNYDQSYFISESNSEMSTRTNTLDSNRCTSTSTQTSSYRNEDPLKYSTSDLSEEELVPFLNYDETLALYEDNQELQQSLLSILHSLNDIHDNFLDRRRVEMKLSQQSSNFIQNNLRAEINSNTGRENDFNLPNFVNDPVTSPKSYVRKSSTNRKKNNSNRLEFDDFDSIEKIRKVSDELKNMWLFGTEDVQVKPRKPSRSVSFNRGMRKKKKAKKVASDNDESSSDCCDYSDYMNEKSLSMPNLCLTDTQPSYFTKQRADGGGSLSPTHGNTTFNQPDTPNFFADNFVKQMKNENENGKCYEVTLNFLQRMMEACKTMDDEGGDGGRCNFSPQPDHLPPYNTYMRTF